MNKIKVLLIEDNRLLRDGISAMLKHQTDIKVIAASGNRENTVIKLQQLNPDIILLDLGLRSQNSLNVVEIVKKDFPNAKVIVMDLSPVQGDIIQYVKAGAAGFILKDATLDDFLNTIRSVAEGVKVLPPNLVGSLFSQIIEHALKTGKTKLNEAVRMTKREKEVISLIAEGLTNKEIGRKLNVSNYTIKSHVHNIMEKLTLHTRLEVANYSFSDGILKTISKDMTTLNK
ncbi:MAG: response regulator transcription factor [Ignavibacteriaceae bacterium]